jgi:tRNA-2-methylthio-N6-dimethylallyladenosine synthase
VLFSRAGKHAGQVLGYSPYMQSVHVENGAHLSGLVAQVEIVGASMTSLTGRQERISVVNQEASA